MNDPFVGTLTFTRIYSGVLTAGSSVKNSVKGKTERIGRMLQMHANERTEVRPSPPPFLSFPPSLSPSPLLPDP